MTNNPHQDQAELPEQLAAALRVILLQNGLWVTDVKAEHSIQQIVNLFQERQAQARKGEAGRTDLQRSYYDAPAYSQLANAAAQQASAKVGAENATGVNKNTNSSDVSDVGAKRAASIEGKGYEGEQGSLSGAYHDGYRDGFATAKHEAESELAAKLAEARRTDAQELQAQIARYGDGMIVYHNGEAVVPISKVLAQLTPPPTKSAQLSNPKQEDA